MKERKQESNILITYTKGEEIFNMVSHIVGASIGIAVLTLCIIFAAINNNGYGIASGIVYGIALIIYYTISSIYHGLSSNTKAKEVFKILKECTAFLLMAGTYTPFILCVIREYNVIFGWWMFGIIWFIAAIGIALNSINIKKINILTLICYVLIILFVILQINIIFNKLGLIAVMLFVLGIVLYLIGAIIYSLDKHKWIHSMIHLIYICASIVHALCILLYIV